jgi:hypothetical protein
MEESRISDLYTPARSFKRLRPSTNETTREVKGAKKNIRPNPDKDHDTLDEREPYDNEHKESDKDSHNNYDTKRTADTGKHADDSQEHDGNEDEDADEQDKKTDSINSEEGNDVTMQGGNSRGNNHDEKDDDEDDSDEEHDNDDDDDEDYEHNEEDEDEDEDDEDDEADEEDEEEEEEEEEDTEDNAPSAVTVTIGDNGYHGPITYNLARSVCMAATEYGVRISQSNHRIHIGDKTQQVNFDFESADDAHDVLTEAKSGKHDTTYDAIFIAHLIAGSAGWIPP